MSETLHPGTEWQSQQQEEDATYDKDSASAADTGHGPGELMMERNCVVTGEEEQDRLMEDQQGEEDQESWGDRGAG